MACVTLVHKVFALSVVLGTLTAYNSVYDLIDFGPLVYFDSANPIFSRSAAIELIQEDVNNPGSFIFATVSGLKRYSPSTGISMLCGNETVRGYRDGPALNARFFTIIDFVQYNKTRIAILDFAGGCVRDYDQVTDTVSTLVGKCTGGNKRKYDGEPTAITADVLLYPISLVYLKSSNLFLVSSINNGVLKVDMKSGTIEQFNIKVANILFMLLNTEETMLYTASWCGVSAINLTTLDSKVFIDNGCYEDGQNSVKGMEPELREGKFSEAALGRLSKPVWVIPDYVFMAVSGWRHESVVLVDLKKNYVHVLCKGSEVLPETITGPPTECKINSPVSVFISNDDACIATLHHGERNSYSYTTNSSLLKMKLNIKRCESVKANDIDIHYPNRTQYDIYSTMTVSCPDGYGLNSSYSTITCTESENDQITGTALKSSVKLQWDKPIPTCVDSLAIDPITPNSGQRAGGTLVTATGVIPREELIQIYTYQSQTKAQNFTKKENMIIFTMPPSEDLSSDRVTLEFLLINSQNMSMRFSFTFTYTDNPRLSNQSLINIRSGGLDGVFCVEYIRSAYVYMIESQATGSRGREVCRIEDSCVLCPLPKCPSNDSDTCTVNLYGDGVVISSGGDSRTESRRVTVLPDPVVIYNNVELPVSKESAETVLTLYGNNLSLSHANRFYQVLLVLLPESATVNCAPVIGQITDTSLPCVISVSLITMYRNYTVKVRIGALDLDVGNVVFTQLPEKKNILDSDSISKGTIASSIAIPAVVVLAVIALVVYLRKRKYSMLSQDANLKLRLTINKELLAEVKLMEIDPARLSVSHNQKIGQGHFGVIYMGQLHSKENIFRVAIKTVKATEITGAKLEDFLKEAVLTRKYYHINVLPVIGVCWSEECIPQVVLPYMANGDLKSVLSKPSLMLTVGDLLHFAKQVACGMEYLSRNNVIHRDLAARNCLVSETYILKISDFGLSRDLYNKDYYRLNEESCKELPVKWMSIESLRSGLFTTSSDVWSFGVLLWEICTRGSEPYPNIEPRIMLSYLQVGNRLPHPSYTPDVIYELMENCWKEEMSERPSFTAIHEFLRQSLEGSTLEPISMYSYVRECTKDIPDDYFHGNHEDKDYENIYIDNEKVRNVRFSALPSCFP